MSVKCFIDSNILVYLNDYAYPEKQNKSVSKIKETLKNGNGVISTQIFHEFYVTSTKKLKIPPTAVRKQMDSFLDFEIVVIDVPLIKEAIDCSILDQISYWDALIIVSAQKAECDVILTEDLNHGQVIKGVKVENIFK